MEPDHDRPPLVGRCGAGPDIEREAVFAFGLGPKIAHRVGRAIGLDAAWAERVCRARAAPFLRRLRRLPTQAAEWRLCVRHAPERANHPIGAPLPFECAGFDLHHAVLHGAATLLVCADWSRITERRRDSDGERRMRPCAFDLCVVASRFFYARGRCWSFYTAKTHLRRCDVKRTPTKYQAFKRVRNSSGDVVHDRSIAANVSAHFLHGSGCGGD